MLNDASDTKKLYSKVFLRLSTHGLVSCLSLYGLVRAGHFECFWIIISFNLTTCQKSKQHYEKKFTKNILCPKILNKFTKFEEYLTNCQKINFCLVLLKISKNLLNLLNI